MLETSARSATVRADGRIGGGALVLRRLAVAGVCGALAACHSAQARPSTYALRAGEWESTVACIANAANVLHLTPILTDSSISMRVAQSERPAIDSRIPLQEDPYSLAPNPALGWRESKVRSRDDRGPKNPPAERLVYALLSTARGEAVQSSAVAQDLRGVTPLNVPASLRLLQLQARVDESCLAGRLSAAE